MSSQEGDASITFGGLTPREFEAFESFELGASYLRVINGRLHAYHAYEDLPSPEDDPILSPHWKSGEVKHFGGVPAGEGWHSPGIIITALGAGGGQDARKRSQEIVTECGFVCLRSPRGDDGRYWEQWVLHFMEAAKGPLKKHMDEWKKGRTPSKKEWVKSAEEAARFLTVTLGVAYGSLDITIQRWALCSE